MHCSAQRRSATSAATFRTRMHVSPVPIQACCWPKPRRRAMQRAAGWQIVNIDSTIVAQAPKLAPHIPAMCQRIADLLALQKGCVNVKAKTAEHLGPVGQGLAIEARAVCLLQRLPD
jgi:YgbB family